MSRAQALQKELTQLETVNRAVGELISTLRNTRQNIAATENATEDTQLLLEKWVRILSQAHFTKDILSNPNWQAEHDENHVASRLQQELELAATLAALQRENEQLRAAHRERRGTKRPRTPGRD